MICSNLDEDEAQVDWNIVQSFLLSTDADCLILLDCRYAAKGAKDAGKLLPEKIIEVPFLWVMVPA